MLVKNFNKDFLSWIKGKRKIPKISLAKLKKWTNLRAAQLTKSAFSIKRTFSNRFFTKILDRHLLIREKTRFLASDRENIKSIQAGFDIN